MHKLAFVLLPLAAACSSSPVSSEGKAAIVSVSANNQAVPTSLIFRNNMSKIGAVVVNVEGDRPIVVSRVTFHSNQPTPITMAKLERENGQLMSGPSHSNADSELIFRDTFLLSPGETTLVVWAWIDAGLWQTPGVVLNLSTNPRVDWEADIPGVGPVRWNTGKIVTSSQTISGKICERPEVALYLDPPKGQTAATGTICSTISWTSTNASSCYASGGPWSGFKSPSDHETVCVMSGTPPVTFSIHCRSICGHEEMAEATLTP